MSASAKFIFASLLALAWPLAVPAATTVSGVIVNQTWTSAGSPYLVVGDLLISRLTIQPGVSVQFQGQYRMEVAGILKAVGTEQDPIVFSRGTNSVTGWNGIFFNESQPGSELVYCMIGGASSYGVRVLNVTPVLRDCSITNNSGSFGGLVANIPGKDWVVSSSLFANNTAGSQFGGGVHVYAPTGSVAFELCKFLGNTSASLGGGLYANAATIHLTNCSFMGNSSQGGGGLYYEGVLEMRSCRLEWNSSASGGALAASGPASLVNCIVAHNTGQSGSWAIRFFGNPFGITNCTIAFNSTGGLLDEGGSGNQVVNSIFWGNQGFQIAGTPTVSYSDIQGGWPGVGNIAFNPIFYSTTNLALVDGSPCIDAGDPDPAFDDVCFPPSAGTNRNDMGAYGGPGACDWPIAPRFTVQPRSQITCVGRDVAFSALAIGEGTLSYQWRFNGADILDATNTSYSISNVQTNHAGLYSVAASNMFDTVVSDEASLTVNAICLSIELYAGLTITAATGQTYRVEYVNELSATNQWSFLTNVFQASTDVLWIDPEPANLQRRFYRVLSGP